MELRSNLWFTNSEKGYFGKGRVALLEQIDKTGSISKAAREMKMSYKAAWDAVNEMNALSNEPIVQRETGGKGGGGTVLTAKGREYIALYKQIEQTQELFFKALGEYADDPKKLLAFTSKLTLRTSARNQIAGVVTAVKRFKTNAEVKIKIANEIEVVVVVTTRSLKELDIYMGKQLHILLKSSWITLVKELPNIERDTNYIKGTIAQVQEDESHVEIIVALDETHQLVSFMPLSTFSALDAGIGDTVWALFDTSSALLAV